MDQQQVVDRINALWSQANTIELMKYRSSRSIKHLESVLLVCDGFENSIRQLKESALSVDGPDSATKFILKETRLLKNAVDRQRKRINARIRYIQQLNADRSTKYAQDKISNRLRDATLGKILNYLEQADREKQHTAVVKHDAVVNPLMLDLQVQQELSTAAAKQATDIENLLSSYSQEKLDAARKEQDSFFKSENLENQNNSENQNDSESENYDEE